MRKKLRNLATSWLERKSLLQSIVHTSLETSEEVHILQIRSSGHRKKFIFELGSEKYICLVNLNYLYTSSLANMHRAALGRNIPLAKFVAVGQDSWFGLRCNYLMLSWCEGVPCRGKYITLDQSHCQAIGSAFAKLHSVHETEMGFISRSQGPQVENRKALESRLRELSSHYFGGAETAPTNTFELVNSLFCGGLASLDDDDFRYLIHGDPHGDNILIGEDGIHLIDTDLMGIGFPLLEFVRLLMENFLRQDIEMQTSVLSAYLESVSDRLRKVWEERVAFVAVAAFVDLIRMFEIRASKVSDLKKSRRHRITAEALRHCCVRIASNHQRYQQWGSVIQEFHQERLRRESIAG